MSVELVICYEAPGIFQLVSFYFFVQFQPSETLLDAYLRLDKEICLLESLCPGPRLASTELWISLLESQLSRMSDDVIQLPLHMIDNEENNIEMKYDRNDELEKDVYSVAKVRQVCNIFKFNLLI